MSEFWKKTLLFILADIVAAVLLLFDNQFVFVLFTLWLMFQLIGGFIMAVGKKNKIVGQSLLAAFGLFLLVGFSVCSILFMSASSH